VKYYVTFGTEEREGYSRVSPAQWAIQPELMEEFFRGDIEEVCLNSVYEKLPNPLEFFTRLDALLKPGAKIVISAPYYRSTEAWTSPLTCRSVSEASFSWFNKEWRATNKWSDVQTSLDYEVVTGISYDQGWDLKNNDTKSHAITHFCNVVRQIVVTLTKK